MKPLPENCPNGMVVVVAVVEVVVAVEVVMKVVWSI
jgi:hypothetical protein